MEISEDICIFNPIFPDFFCPKTRKPENREKQGKIGEKSEKSGKLLEILFTSCD